MAIPKSMGPHTNRAALAGKAGDTERVVQSIRRIVRELRQTHRTAEQRLGISGAQLFVLHQLRRGPVDSLQTLADRTLTHQSSVSVVVSRLVRKGWVRRRPSA